MRRQSEAPREADDELSGLKLRDLLVFAYVAAGRGPEGPRALAQQARLRPWWRVHLAIRRLDAEGLIERLPDGSLELSARGRERAPDALAAAMVAGFEPDRPHGRRFPGDMRW